MVCCGQEMASQISAILGVSERESVKPANLPLCPFLQLGRSGQLLVMWSQATPASDENYRDALSFVHDEGPLP
jgi:hypothetical protein